MDECIELLHKVLLVRCIDRRLLHEYLHAVSSDSEEKRIADHITDPSEKCDDKDIKESHRCKKCTCNRYEWSLDDHQPEHDKIPSFCERIYDSGIEILCEIHRKIREKLQGFVLREITQKRAPSRMSSHS